MKLSFDKAATRKLELWATHLGIDISGDEKVWVPAIAFHVLQLVETELTKCRPQQEGGAK